jgi:hypothetical protein
VTPPEVELAGLEQDVHELGEWLAVVDRQHVEEYVAAIAEAERVRLIVDYVAAEANRPRLAGQPAAPTATGTTVGGACGGATNGADAFIGRESGGNPDIANPSGAWGCYQIMPDTWRGAGCDEFGTHGSASVEAQAACASKLPLSAWNASGPT